MIGKDKLNELEAVSKEMRLDLLRMFWHGKAHHFGGSFSCVEIVAALYFYKMNISKELMESPERDRFIMSKGHTVPTQYIALSGIGVLPRDELKTIKQLGTRLQGHPDIRKTPGVEAPTGSLGQGISFANGIALAGRLDGLKFYLYLIVGDGELQEGQNWEALMTSAHYKLGNMCILVDRNKYQSQGSIDDLMGIEPLEDKFRAFGWESMRVDGHNIEELCTALDRFPISGSKPMAIICDTIKGKGIHFIEDTYKYHNYMLSEEEFRNAEKELSPS